MQMASSHSVSRLSGASNAVSLAAVPAMMPRPTQRRASRVDPFDASSTRKAPTRREAHLSASIACDVGTRPTRSTPPVLTKREQSSKTRELPGETLSRSPRELLRYQPALLAIRRGLNGDDAGRHKPALSATPRDDASFHSNLRRPHNLVLQQKQHSTCQKSIALLGSPRNTQPGLGGLHSRDGLAAMGHGTIDNHDP